MQQRTSGPRIGKMGCFSPLMGKPRVSFQLADPINKEDPVQMVDLVLEHDCRQTFFFEFNGILNRPFCVHLMLIKFLIKLIIQISIKNFSGDCLQVLKTNPDWNKAFLVNRLKQELKVSRLPRLPGGK